MTEPTPYRALRLFAEGLIEELEDEHSCTEVAVYRRTLADIDAEREEESRWAHVFMDPDTHEPTLLPDNLLEEAREAVQDILAGQFIDRAWIRPGPLLEPDVAPTSVGGTDG